MLDEPGKLQCVCTTPECARDGTTTCRADNFCYVQVIPPVSASVSGARSSRADVTRGCIDEDTPLLCENKRPSTYRGAWPVLHCCSDDWCNRDVIPTLPPWASHVEGYRCRSIINHLNLAFVKRRLNELLRGASYSTYIFTHHNGTKKSKQPEKCILHTIYIGLHPHFLGLQNLTMT